MGRGSDAETGESTGKAKITESTGEAGAAWVLGGVGTGQGAQLVLWGPGQCWGALCAFLPYIPLLLGQEGPASGSLLFSHHLSILPHLSSKMWRAKGRHRWVASLLSSHPAKLCAWEQKILIFPLPGIMA